MYKMPSNKSPKSTQNFTLLDNQDMLEGLVSQLGETHLRSSLTNSSLCSTSFQNQYKPVGRKIKKKKQLRFSSKSTLHVFERPEKNTDLYINENDRARFETDSALAIRKIHDTVRQVPPTVLKNQCQNTDSMAEGMVFLIAHNHLASEKKTSDNQVQPEEMIGLEHFLHGFEYVSGIAEKKKKVVQFVVEGWHKLHGLQAQQGLDDDSVAILDDIEEQIANVYAKMTKKSALRARRRADCVHWLSQKAQQEEQKLEAPGLLQQDLKGGKSSSVSHQLSGPLRRGNSINFRRRSKTASAA